MDYTESDIVELKSEVSSDICKEVVAFVNSHGGAIYIGVADDGSVVGVEDPDTVILRLNNMIRDSIKPDVIMFIHYEAKIEHGKTIVCVTVQRGTDRPYYLASKGLKPSGVYVRNGTASDPASDTAIRKMIKETDGDSFEELRSLEQELTFHAAETEFQKCNVAFDPSKFRALGVTTSDEIFSNLGMLLSDQCAAVMKVAVFSGTDKSIFQDRREFSGSLLQQIEDVYAFLALHNQTKATFQGLYRTDSQDYPEDALREALMNAIVHRDYSYSASTLISIYEDRIEFVSIGGLPDGVELEDIMLGLSVCRNPKLAAVFYRLKLIEAYGTGMPKIMRAYQGTGKTPKVEATNNAFKITLPNVNASTPDAAMIDTTDSPERAILAYLKEHTFIVRPEVDQLLGVSQATSSRILKRLVSEGMVVQEGRGKATKYRLK